MASECIGKTDLIKESGTSPSKAAPLISRPGKLTLHHPGLVQVQSARKRGARRSTIESVPS